MSKQTFVFHEFDQASKSSIKQLGIFFGLFFGLLVTAGALVTDSHGETVLTSGNTFAIITYWVFVLMSILCLGAALFSAKHVTNTQVTVSEYSIVLTNSNTRGKDFSLQNLYMVHMDYRRQSSRYSSHTLAAMNLLYPDGQQVKLIQYPVFDEEMVLQKGDAHQTMLDLKEAIETRAAALQNIPSQKFQQREKITVK